MADDGALLRAVGPSLQDSTTRASYTATITVAPNYSEVLGELPMASWSVTAIAPGLRRGRKPGCPLELQATGGRRVGLTCDRPPGVTFEGVKLLSPQRTNRGSDSDGGRDGAFASAQ